MDQKPFSFPFSSLGCQKDKSGSPKNAKASICSGVRIYAYAGAGGGATGQRCAAQRDRKRFASFAVLVDMLLGNPNVGALNEGAGGDCLVSILKHI